MIKNKEIAKKENNELIGKIEAILFAVGEPISVVELAKFFKISKEEIKKNIKKIKDNYHSEKRGFEIIEKKDRVQLVSNAQFGKEVMKFMKKEINEALSPASLEVLAVIAYRGPLTRAEIDYIRGVNCSFILRNLAIRGLIEKRENPNDTRSYLYEISFDFLNSLGVNKIEDLPEFENLKKITENINNASENKN